MVSKVVTTKSICVGMTGFHKYTLKVLLKRFVTEQTVENNQKNDSREKTELVHDP